MKIYVIDTETTTTDFKDPKLGGRPNGHIVELGLVRLDTWTGSIINLAHYIFKDEEASGEEWVYKNTDLPYRSITFDDIRIADAELRLNAMMFADDMLPITAFNWTGFDRWMIERDLPRFSDVCRWLPDIMDAADKIDAIPRKIHDSGTGFVSKPSVQSTWDYLFPRDPMTEQHRALSDAWQEARILKELIKMGIYKLPEGI